MKKWDRRFAIYLNKVEKAEEELATVYSVVWGQCSEAMRIKVRESDLYQEAHNPIKLIEIIKNVAYDYKSHEHPVLAIRKALYDFYRLQQGKGQSVYDYLTTFNNMVKVLDSVGAGVGRDKGVVGYAFGVAGVTCAEASAEQRSAAATAAREQFLAMSFLMGSDRSRFQLLINELANDYLKGTNNYPTTLMECFTLMSHWIGEQDEKPKGHNGNAFANVESDGKDEGQFTLINNGRSTNKYNGPPCTRCGRTNHGTESCIAKTHADGTLLVCMEVSEQHQGLMFTQKHDPVPSEWILLDNQSTVDVFSNSDLLHDIHESGERLNVHCNTGITTTTQRGVLPGYGEVWYNPNGIANILSLSRVKGKFHVRYDSGDGNAFCVSRNGREFYFQESSKGLYYMVGNAFDKGNDDEFVMVDTVADNRSRFSNHDYRQAELARRIQIVTGRPSTKTLIKMINTKSIMHCPITERDVLIAEQIFGPDLGSLKGKTVRTKATAVKVPHNSLPFHIMEQYGTVTICVDVMRVNKIPFLITISQHIHFGTCERLDDLKEATLLKAIENVWKLYKQRGFSVRYARADNEFTPLRADLAAMGVDLNDVGRDEHVPEVERYIRTIKERARSTYNTLPFKHYPPALIVEMVYASVFWLNMTPTRAGVGNHSPAYLVVGRQIDYNKHCQLQFGEYVQTHEEHDNSMQSRTIGALALRPTGNTQGGWFFLSLTTGRRLTRRRWTPLPMPDEVINQVHRMARRAKATRNLTFTYDANVPIEDEDGDGEDDDSTYAPDDDASSATSSSSSDDASSDDDDESNSDDPSSDDDDENGDDTAPHVENNNNNDNEITGVDNNPPHMQQRRSESGIIMRPRTRIDYKALHEGSTFMLLHIDHNTAGIVLSEIPLGDNDGCNEITMLTAQMNLKQGLKKFGKHGELAVGGELRQVHDMKGVKPVHGKSLTELDKKRALRYLMYLKEKRDGSIKARGCADGRKQRLWTNKEDASSPTVALGSLMLSCAIDAHENRKVGVVDLPGAFLQTSMNGEETVHILLEGRMAELMVQVDPVIYTEYLFYVNGRAYMYVELTRALYGTLKAAVLFWADLTKELVSMGFEINPYDWCVANKQVNGSQCTIVWHVDDLKISHIDQKVIEDVVQLLDKRYGKVSPLTVAFGDKHEYLGMGIHFPGDGSVIFNMESYVEGILAETSHMKGEAETPGADHLFTVSDTTAKLSKENSESFHHIVAKLLYISKRGRPDIQTAVAFLCTRVQEPDEDDYKKLTRVIRYLRKTHNETLTLKINDITQTEWWVDGAFATHPDMRSHTGGYMSMGHGCLYSCSNKQKLNTKSSTEAKLVAVDDVIGQILWTQYFLSAQGYQMKPAIIHQDNKSAILLERNGRASSGKRTRHVNIRYFFVTDRVKSGEVTVQYCPTDEMIGDFFTKPVQGGKFKQLKRKIMGRSASITVNSMDAQECVGNIVSEKLNDARADGPDNVSGPHSVTWAEIVSRNLRDQSA